MYSNSQVIEVTDADFIVSKQPKMRNTLWKQGDRGYLLVYASWCPNCQNKVDMWKKLATETHADYQNKRFLVTAADIDTAVPKLAAVLGIDSIPRLFEIDAKGNLEPLDTDWSPVDLRKRI